MLCVCTSDILLHFDCSQYQYANEHSTVTHPSSFLSCSLVRGEDHSSKKHLFLQDVFSDKQQFLQNLREASHVLFSSQCLVHSSASVEQDIMQDMNSIMYPAGVFGNWQQKIASMRNRTTLDLLPGSCNKRYR